MRMWMYKVGEDLKTGNEYYMLTEIKPDDMDERDCVINPEALLEAHGIKRDGNKPISVKITFTYSR